jgi:hypothetical protein
MALVFLGALTAADAGRVGEDGTGAMWVAPELLEAVAAVGPPGCTSEAVVEVTTLQTNGRVAFEWHPATGELSFAEGGVKPAITLPADFRPESLVRATRSCGSR